MRIRSLATLSLLACALALPAAAERADREKEIVIGADRSSADDANKLLTLEGNVVVTQGTMRITAAKVVVREDAQKNKFYVATGAPVTFRQKRDKVDEWINGEAQRAEFDEKADVLKLFTRARVKSGPNEITGDFISYDMAREVAEASGAAPGAVVPKDSRVKVIIVPQKKAGEGKDAPAAAPPLELKPDAGKN
jgi:lipopolysaccharide export system protein LptA